MSGKPDIAKHSATIPCPANAASPCIKTGITFFLLFCERIVFALTCPNTTGFTASKWDGLSVAYMNIITIKVTIRRGS